MGLTEAPATKNNATITAASSDNLNTTLKVPDKYADESFKLFSKLADVSEPSPEKAKEIRNRCVRRVLPFLCIGYHLMYIDKQTVSII